MKIEIKDGIVSKDGDEIGMIQGETCHLLAKVGPTVKGAIRKESGVELAFVVGDAPDEDEGNAPDDSASPESEQSNSDMSTGMSVSSLSDDELAAEMKRRGLIQNAPEISQLGKTMTGFLDAVSEAQRPVNTVDLSAVERLHKLADEGKIPKPPAKHPAMGDKTPEYVAWFKTHATPEEIAARYPDNRRVPASIAEFAKAQAKIYDKLPGEKKDTGKDNDFTDKAE